jgi:hypothetical protein
MTDTETAITNCNSITDQFNLIFFILNIFMITELTREPAQAFQAEPFHGLNFSSRTNVWLELFSSWLMSHRAFLIWLGLA